MTDLETSISRTVESYKAAVFAREIYAFTRVDFPLPIQRQVVGVFRGEHRRQESGPRIATGERSIRRLRLDNPLAAMQQRQSLVVSERRARFVNSYQVVVVAVPMAAEATVQSHYRH